MQTEAPWILGPFFSPLVALAVAVGLPWVTGRARTPRRSIAAGAAFLLLLAGGYWALSFAPAFAAWLRALETPLAAVFLVLVYPALQLPRGRLRQAFYLLPAGALVLLGWGVYAGLQALPPDAGPVQALLVRPTYLLSGVVALLVLLQPILSLGTFRRVVRLSSLVLLLYGGLIFRTGYEDYQRMREMRRQQTDLLNVSETAPVMDSEQKPTHVPSAVCRFAPGGGYVQGCPVEWTQRVLQTDFTRVGRGEVAAVNGLGALLAGGLVLVSLLFLTGRWTCGWVCPLATLGDGIDWARRRTGRDPLRPSKPVKRTLFVSGLTVAGITALMAKAVPHLDENGSFAGCKIPIYPFCKICPFMPICGVAGAGPGGFPPLPTVEWAFGFFRYGLLALLALFVVGFAVGRRLWCRFCPIGMVAGLFNRGGALRLTKRGIKCNRCGACTEACPMEIEAVRDELERGEVTTFDCVLCLRCIEACPRDACLGVTYEGRELASSRFRKEP